MPMKSGRATDASRQRASHWMRDPEFTESMAEIEYRAKSAISRGPDFGGGDAHRVFTAAQNCSVTAVVSSVTFQPFVSAFSLANFCSF